MMYLVHGQLEGAKVECEGTIEYVETHKLDVKQLVIIVVVCVFLVIIVGMLVGCVVQDRKQLKTFKFREGGFGVYKKQYRSLNSAKSSCCKPRVKVDPKKKITDLLPEPVLEEEYESSESETLKFVKRQKYK